MNVFSRYNIYFLHIQPHAHMHVCTQVHIQTHTHRERIELLLLIYHVDLENYVLPSFFSCQFCIFTPSPPQSVLIQALPFPLLRCLPRLQSSHLLPSKCDSDVRVNFKAYMLKFFSMASNRFSRGCAHLLSLPQFRTYPIFFHLIIYCSSNVWALLIHILPIMDFPQPEFPLLLLSLYCSEVAYLGTLLNL